MFRAGGKEFDVERFLAESKLTPFKSWKIGETHGRGNKTHEFNGFTLIASNADFSEVEKQLAESALFLNEHRDALTLLAKFAGVEFAILDFGIHFGSDLACSSIVFPPELAKAAGLLNVGLEATFYLVDEKPQHADE